MAHVGRGRVHQILRCSPMPRSDRTKTKINTAKRTPTPVLRIRFVAAGMDATVFTTAAAATSRTAAITSSMTVIGSLYAL